MLTTNELQEIINPDCLLRFIRKILTLLKYKSLYISLWKAVEERKVLNNWLEKSVV